jgi:hypothetical protein
MGVALYALYFHCVQTFTTFFQFELHVVAVFDFVDQTGCVYEVLLVGSVVLDETETFGFIKELYNAFFHVDDDNDVDEALKVGF